MIVEVINVGLPNLVVRLVVQVFGGKGGAINGGTARITFADEVLLNQPHGFSFYMKKSNEC